MKMKPDRLLELVCEIEGLEKQNVIRPKGRRGCGVEYKARYLFVYLAYIYTDLNFYEIGSMISVARSNVDTLWISSKSRLSENEYKKSLNEYHKIIKKSIKLNKIDLKLDTKESDNQLVFTTEELLLIWADCEDKAICNKISKFVNEKSKAKRNDKD